MISEREQVTSGPFAPYAAPPTGGGAQLPRPLAVDVDGTLVRGDLLWEGLVQLCVRAPARIPGLVVAALRGRAPLKEFVARSAPLGLDSVPLEPAVMRLIDLARAEGRPVILVSGAHETHVAELGRRVRADHAWGSDGRVNLTGQAKLDRMRAHCAEFDYVGDSSADLPLLAAAARAYAVDTNGSLVRRARRLRPSLEVLATFRTPWASLVRAMRPHQWAKNALLLLPPLAAHVTWTAPLVARFALGAIAFSLLASAVYLLNDALDAPADRAHRTKRRRPIAAGDLSLPAALGAALALVTVVALGALFLLPPQFGAVLAGYFVATTAYSLALKRQPLVDVIVLAMLYASRLAAGAALAGVPLSGWFVAFAIFFFLSLALAKRAVEVRVMPAAADPGARGYMAVDLTLLTALGMGSTVASAVVFGLYITQGAVVQLYQRPDLLWLGLPILLYWQARVWLLTGRGAMHDDPVVFALRDARSYVLFGAFMLIVAIAA